MTTQPRSNTLINYRIRPKLWNDSNLADAVRQIADGSEYWGDEDRKALLVECADRLEKGGRWL